MCGWVTPLRKPIELRSARIREIQEFGHLIEALPCCIIHCASKNPMLHRSGHTHQQCVATAHNEGNVGLEGFKVRSRWGSRNPRRIKMSLVVMDTKKRAIQCEGQSLSELEPGHQRIGQARPLSGRNRCDLTDSNPRTRERFVSNERKISDMLTGGQFRDHATVLLMQSDLRSHDIRKHTAVANNRNTGFIARSLDAQQNHAITLVNQCLEADLKIATSTP